jgi:hypothetical protein
MDAGMSLPLPRCTRLPLRFDAAALQAAVDALPADAWEPHFNRGYYVGDWSGVALRAPRGAHLALAPGEGDGCDTPLCDAFWRAQLAQLQTPLRSARLLRLGPGGCIREHCDHDLGHPDSDRRLHVPIVTDERVDFLLDGLRVPMRPGECWFLDLARPHRVENHGGTARVHLVLDARPSPWLDAQLAAGAGDTPPCVPSRGSAAFAAFRDRVHADPALERALLAHESTDDFVAAVLAQAAALDLHFSAEEVAAAMAQGRRAWQAQRLA